MSLRSNNPGIHFKDPWLMEARTQTASGLAFYDSAKSLRVSDTTAFFTGFAQYGIQDNTNWTSNTYKTIYSHTGMGLVYSMLACTAGGAETTTFEITLDGVLKTITITNASGERASLSAASTSVDSSGNDFSTALIAFEPQSGSSLDAATLTTFQASASQITMVPPKFYSNVGIPALRYDTSCLIRMKHSASITNSTATAFSGVLVRKGIAS